MPGKADVRREVKDVFSNPVFCFTSTWQLIETVKHPDIAGYESMVYETIENPDIVMESTLHDAAAIFETTGTGPYGRDLPVVVNYDDPKYTLGNTRGTLTTAYDRDIRRYPKPNIGKVLYSKKKGSQK